MVTYYKATRLYGTSRGGVEWRVGEVTTHPLVCDEYSGAEHLMVRNDASTYLSLSVEPGETLIGGSYPCRMFEVEPVGDIETSDYYPHKRCVLAAGVVRELPGHLALGPTGSQIDALLDRVRRMTSDEIEQADAAWVAAWGAAWVAARGAAMDAAGDAARGAAIGAARGAAIDAAMDAAMDAARGVAMDAAGALVVRDLITSDQFDTLTGPLFSAIGTEWMDGVR